MEKVTNEQKIAALKIARVRVKDKNSWGVLSGICLQLPYDNVAGDYLRDFITKSLGSHPWLSSWISCQKGMAGQLEQAQMDGTYREKLTTTRLAWIDWMITCLEEDIAAGKLA